MVSLKDRFKEILLKEQLIDPHVLSAVLIEQEQTGVELSKLLIDQKLISEDGLAQIFSQSLELPTINLQRIRIDPALVQKIPFEFADKYQVIPVSFLGETLTVGMVDPLNVFVIDNIQMLTGYQIQPVVARRGDLRTAIEAFYRSSQSESIESIDDAEEAGSETFADIIQDIQDIEDLELVKDGVGTGGHGDVEQIADEAPIIRLTDTVIQQAVFAKASDVFIEPMEKCVRVRYRIDGVIREIDRMAKVLHFPIISRIKVISNLDISEHRLPQDGRFKTIISGDRSVDFRVNVLPTAMGEKAVLRVLDQAMTVLDIDGLGFEPRSLERLKACALKPHGMILTCGPTGSGKTTTLYSILKHVDSPEKNIVTVEDPVEYQMKGVNQVNVRPNVGLTFGSCLRSILRQDPDIILIGEIRDAETLDIAVKAALTGHLVLSSLHTTTAAGSVIRMMNMGVEPFLICSAVLAIVAQRLLRRICPNCKESYDISPELALRVGFNQVTGVNGPLTLHRGTGCKACFQTGYKGRVGITEILTLSTKVKDLILNRAGEFKIKEAARTEGMRTMREDALIKALDGATTLEEVLRITASDEAME
jgi:type IV pilus assembly protein PilB